MDIENCQVAGVVFPDWDLLVDVPRFELGASSMPRKRASKLRHTPSGLTNCGVHLRGT